MVLGDPRRRAGSVARRGQLGRATRAVIEVPEIFDLRMHNLFVVEVPSLDRRCGAYPLQLLAGAGHRRAVIQLLGQPRKSVRPCSRQECQVRTVVLTILGLQAEELVEPPGYGHRRSKLIPSLQAAGFRRIHRHAITDGHAGRREDRHSVRRTIKWATEQQPRDDIIAEIVRVTRRSRTRQLGCLLVVSGSLSLST